MELTIAVAGPMVTLLYINIYISKKLQKSDVL